MLLPDNQGIDMLASDEDTCICLRSGGKEVGETRYGSVGDEGSDIDAWSEGFDTWDHDGEEVGEKGTRKEDELDTDAVLAGLLLSLA